MDASKQELIRGITRLILAVGILGTICYLAIHELPFDSMKDLGLVALTFYFAKDKV